MYGATPYGGLTYGGSLTSGAMASPVTALIAGNLHILFEHLLWLQPYNPVTGIPIDLFVSGGWFKTAGGDTFPTGEAAAHQLFIGHLVQPPNRESRILSNGEVNTGASTYGNCVIADSRRELTQWLSFGWKNATARHFMGDPSWPLSSFAEVFHGVSTALDPEVDQMSIGLQDVVAKLQSRDYQTKRYAGRGACVRLDGAASYLYTGATSCPIGGMTIGIRFRPTAAIATDEHIVGWHNSTGAGERRLHTGPGNSVTWSVRDDSSNGYSVTAAGVLGPYNWIDLWGVLDTAAMRISLYDGSSPDTPIAQASIAGTYVSSVLTSFAVGRLPDFATNFLLGDVDEITVWSRALSTVEIAQWTGQRAPSGTTGLVYQWSLTEATGTIAYESAGAGPDLTLASCAWVDSLTGGVELQGKCIPKGRGIVREINPVLLSAIDRIYQVAEEFDHLATDVSGPLLKDRGIRVWTLKGTYPDPWAATPATGEYMEIPAMGLIRLGSSPVGQLTCDPYLTAATDLPGCVAGITTGDGVLTSGEFDAASAAALPATDGVGVLSGLDPTSVDAVLLKYLASVKGWRGSNPVGALAFGVIAPPETLTPSAQAGPDDFALDGIKPVFTLPAARAALVRYRPYYQTQQPTALDPLLTEAEKQDLGQQFRSVSTPEDLAVLGADSAAELAVRDTVLDSAADAQTQATLEAAWRSKPRRTDYLPYSEPVPRFYVGQVLTITMPVLDYDDGKNVIVTAVLADDGTGAHGCEVTGELKFVGGDLMLTGDGTGHALLGDGTGSGLVE